MNSLICLAIKSKSLIEFEYDSGTRNIEPHCYGVSSAGNEVLRGFQVSGSSVAGEYIGWKLFSLKKISNLKISNQKFVNPRPSYNPNDHQMTTIFCHI